MFHKNVCTGNVSKCENPDFCTVSNIHSGSRSQASKYCDQSEKKLEKIDKLSKADVETLLERKKMEFPYIAEHIDTTMKNFDNVVVSQGENSAPAKHLRSKLDMLSNLLTKVDEDSALLEIRLADFSK